MQKLFRFLSLTLLYIVLLSAFYCIVPFLTMLFGGSFTDVSQNDSYIVIYLILGNIGLCFLFNECFDSDFFSKEDFVTNKVN